ncbi:hypothetical protein OFC46_26295, partial [Escherichia coli]|nr:hypothetical protein [Escherichia coli]
KNQDLKKKNEGDNEKKKKKKKKKGRKTKKGHVEKNGKKKRSFLPLWLTWNSTRSDRDRMVRECVELFFGNLDCKFHFLTVTSKQAKYKRVRC